MESGAGGRPRAMHAQIVRTQNLFELVAGGWGLAPEMALLLQGTSFLRARDGQNPQEDKNPLF